MLRKSKQVFYLLLASMGALAIDYGLMSWFNGALLYVPFVIAGFILYHYCGLKITFFFLLLSAAANAFFMAAPNFPFVGAPSVDLYALLGLWVLSTGALLFLEWTRESFADHH